MSSTRHAPEGTPLRQERFSSSRNFEIGLLANLVARRCALIDPPEDRAALWFIQWRSWQPGGLARLERELLDNYDSDLVGGMRLSDIRPELENLCLNPDSPLAHLWESVDDYRVKWMASHAQGVVQTDIGRRVASAMDYARDTRSMVLISGESRLGKSFAARQFCEQSGGLMRYVQVPSDTDDMAFYRAVASALGVSTNLNLKACDLRARIEDVFQSGDIGVCLDEAHFIWPAGRICRPPRRANWIRLALADANVPTVLITTPQYFVAKANVERQTEWNSDQWDGRVGHVEKLPTVLQIPDLLKVAAVLLPSADQRALSAVASYAFASPRHLQSIAAIAQRATWLAVQDGRETAGTEDVKAAMKGSIIPSDGALSDCIAEGQKGAKRPQRGGFAPSRRTIGRPPADPFSRSITPEVALEPSVAVSVAASRS